MSILRSISYSGVPFDKLLQNPQVLNTNSFNNINVQCPQDMRKLVPAIAQYIWQYMANKVSSHRLRGIHYNMLVADNGGNPELVILVTFVANLAYMKIKSGSFNNIEEAITTCAVWVVDRRLNFITISNDDLANSVADVINDIRATATEYVTEATEVENFLANTYMGGSVNANNSFGNNNNSNNSHGFNNSGTLVGFNNSNNGGGFGNSNNQRGFGSSNTISSFGASSHSGNSSVITRTDNNGVKAQRSNRFENDLMAITSTNAEPAAIQAPKVQEEVKKPTNFIEDISNNLFTENGEINSEVLKLIPPTNLPWQVSPYQQYPIAYDSSNFELVNKHIPSRDGKSSFVISTLKKVNMDRSAHTLSSSELFLSRAVPAGNYSSNTPVREQYKENSLTKVSEVISKVRAIDGESEYINNLEELRTIGHIVMRSPVTSISQAVSHARQAALTYSKTEFGSYTLEFFLSRELIITRQDYADVVVLDKCKTFESLRGRIRENIEDETKPQSLRTAMVQINAYLAERFIDFISFYLCIDEFKTSDSFIDDALEIIDEVGETYGKPYKDLLMSSQERFIKTNLVFGDAFISEIETDILSEDNASITNNDENEKAVTVLPIITSCMLTCTEFMSSEYSLKLPEETGAIFTPESTSKGLFDLTSKFVMNTGSEGLQSNIRRFFIATLDEKIYETNIGLSKETAPLLIRKIKATT